MPDLIPVENDPFGVNLQPVDYDPYAVNLQPVDYDPWAELPAPHGVPQITITPQQQQPEGMVAKQGQIVQPVNARPMTGQAAMMALGVPDISSMTPDEQQMFALGAVPMLAAGPEAKIAEEAAPEVAGAVQQGIRAFHGSPYDFERFDLSKIGTGEGTQAYGHGLYFAENPAVSEQYRHMLGRGDQIAVGGQIIGKMDGDYYDQRAFQWVQSAVRSGSSNIIDDAINRAQSDLEFMQGPRGGTQAAASAQQTLDRLKQWKEQGVSIANPGKTYGVSINADPEHFLDWDKPLSEQPAVAAKLGASPGGPITGEGFLKLLGGGENATEVLRQKGIPGIKYLDQGSRSAYSDWHTKALEDGTFNVVDYHDVKMDGPFNSRNEAWNAINQKKAGAQTSNFVVFDDKLIDIIKKYGLAGLVAGGASHFKTTPVDYNPFATQ